MGGLFSAFWEEGQDNFLGLTKEEAQEIQEEIRKEYGHPKWSSLIKAQSFSSKKKKKGGKFRAKTGKEVIAELSEDTEKETVVVGVDENEIDKALLVKVIQDWESLDSDNGGSLEEEDNVRNMLEEMGKEQEELNCELVEVTEGYTTDLGGLSDEVRSFRRVYRKPSNTLVLVRDGEDAGYQHFLLFCHCY